MRKVALILFLLTTSMVAAAPTQTPIQQDPYTLREAAIVESIQLENQQTRAYIKEFGEETHEMYVAERNKAEKEINSILIKFKFTLAITIFCAFLAALEVHNLLKRRRENKYNAPTVEQAEAIQEKPPIPQDEIPKPPAHLDTRQRCDTA